MAEITRTIVACYLAMLQNCCTAAGRRTVGIIALGVLMLTDHVVHMPQICTQQLRGRVAWNMQGEGWKGFRPRPRDDQL